MNQEVNGILQGMDTELNTHPGDGWGLISPSRSAGVWMLIALAVGWLIECHSKLSCEVISKYTSCEVISKYTSCEVISKYTSCEVMSTSTSLLVKYTTSDDNSTST